MVLLPSDKKRGKSMVVHSTVESRVGLLKDSYVHMDMEHRRQEQKIENLKKDKEAEVSNEHCTLYLVSGLLLTFPWL